MERTPSFRSSVPNSSLRPHGPKGRAEEWTTGWDVFRMTWAYLGCLWILVGGLILFFPRLFHGHVHAISQATSQRYGRVVHAFSCNEGPWLGRQQRSSVALRGRTSPANGHPQKPSLAQHWSNISMLYHVYPCFTCAPENRWDHPTHSTKLSVW